MMNSTEPFTVYWSYCFFVRRWLRLATTDLNVMFIGTRMHQREPALDDCVALPRVFVMMLDMCNSVQFNCKG